MFLNEEGERSCSNSSDLSVNVTNQFIYMHVLMLIATYDQTSIEVQWQKEQCTTDNVGTAPCSNIVINSLCSSG